jgi:hypothetical protein
MIMRKGAFIMRKTMVAGRSLLWLAALALAGAPAARAADWRSLWGLEPAPPAEAPQAPLARIGFSPAPRQCVTLDGRIYYTAKPVCEDLRPPVTTPKPIASRIRKIR